MILVKVRVRFDQSQQGDMRRRQGETPQTPGEQGEFYNVGQKASSVATS